MDSNHRRRSQQIYSLSHLTALETPRGAKHLFCFAGAKVDRFIEPPNFFVTFFIIIVIIYNQPKIPPTPTPLLS